MKWSTVLSDRNFDSHIDILYDLVVKDVNGDSGVGLSFKCSPKPPADLKRLLEDPQRAKEIKMATLTRLRMWANVDIDELQNMLEDDPLALVVGGFVGPYQVIIKPELHEPRKVREGKFRNVKMNEFINQLVERVLDKEYKTCLRWNHEKLPYQAELAYGLSFEDYEAIKLREIVHDKTVTYGKRTTSDVAGWDAGFSVWLCRSSAESRIHAIQAKPNETYYKLANAIRVNHRLLSYAICAVPSADNRLTELHVSLDPGQMPSGSNETTSANGTGRSNASKLEGYDEGRFNGDDAIEFGECKFPFLEKREVHVIECNSEFYTKDFEFCSHKFTYIGCELTSWPKALLTLVAKKVAKPELINAFLREVRHNGREVLMVACEAYLATYVK